MRSTLRHCGSATALQEIHDNVGHMLSRSILQMGALITIHKEEPLHGQLAGVGETLNQG